MCYCKFSHEYFRASDGVWAYNSEGERHFVPKKITKICYECGEVIFGDDLEGENDRYLCKECADTYIKICDDCGEKIYPWQPDYLYAESYIICKHCREEDYFKCECCGRLERNCNGCRTQDDYALCNTCYEEETYICADCGDVFYCRDNVCYDECDEAYYCERCFDSRTRDINNYSYKPRANFLKTEEDEPIENEFFGFEIEVAGDDGEAYSFKEKCGDTNEKVIYLKADGSVDGFEIVTHPMTRNYFYDKFCPNLAKGMVYLARNGFKGHGEGGIHIHVSKDAISEEQLAKLVVLLYPKTEKVKKLWLGITQRSRYNMDRWSTMDPDKLDNGKRETIENIKLGDKCINGNHRYSAINTQNNNTIEFRMFNSNLRMGRIKKNAEVIFSLLDFTKTEELPTMANYLNFVFRNSDKYNNLYEFLLEKQLWQTKEQKEQTQKILMVINHTTGKRLKKEEIHDYLNDLGIVDLAKIDTSVADYEGVY
jgi:hypothetical protein